MVFVLQPSLFSWRKLLRGAAATIVEKAKKDTNWGSGTIVASRT